MSTLTSSQTSCQSASAVTKQDFVELRRHNQSQNLIGSGLGKTENDENKRLRLQSAVPSSSRGVVLAESHNYVSKNSSHFYNSKKAQ